MRKLVSTAGAALASGVLLAGVARALAGHAQASPAAHPGQIVFEQIDESEEMRELLGRFQAKVRSLADAGADLRQELQPLPSFAGDSLARGFEARLGLEIYRALRAGQVPAGFALVEHEQLGALRVYGFDARLGVEASFATKLEKDQKRGDADEPDRAMRAIDEMLEIWQTQHRILAESSASPYVEPARWLDERDPVEFGFRWRYSGTARDALAEVTFVLDNSSLGKAGLRRGDRVVAVNGTATRSPQAFGKAVSSLRGGDPLVLDVERAGHAVTLRGAAERASQVIPEFEQEAVGAPLPPFRADVGAAPVEVGAGPSASAASAASSHPAAATLVLVFDPSASETLADLAVLAWLCDHHPREQVAIAGIATKTTPEELKAAMDELKPGWPAAADPDGLLAQATHTLLLPALLVADAHGTVRFRRAHGAELHQALRTVLAESR
jgi:PDZ domain-containing protein